MKRSRDVGIVVACSKYFLPEGRFNTKKKQQKSFKKMLISEACVCVYVCASARVCNMP